MRADVENLQIQVVEQITPRVQGLESRGHGLELRAQSSDLDGKGNSFGLLEVDINFLFLNFASLILFLNCRGQIRILILRNSILSFYLCIYIIVTHFLDSH